jgi:multidrug transporter EmrE-like cation transporter
MKLAIFIMGSAAFYSGAMILMKFWGADAGASRVLIGLFIVITIVGAVFFEIEALRSEKLGMVYVAILGFECVFIGTASVLWFGEHFTVKEIVGSILIVMGTAVAWS